MADDTPKPRCYVQLSDGTEIPIQGVTLIEFKPSEDLGTVSDDVGVSFPTEASVDLSFEIDEITSEFARLISPIQYRLPRLVMRGGH